MLNFEKAPSKKRFKLAILSSHPIQYFAPLYRRLALEESIDLTVYYCSRQGVDEYHDNQLGISLKWDTPLLEGYRYKFLPDIWGNVPSQYQRRMPQPAIVNEIIRGNYDALWLYSYKPPTFMLAMIAAKISGASIFIRTDTHLRSADLQQKNLKNKLRSPLLRLIFKLFDGALAIGTNNAEHYRAHGMPDNRIFLVPYAVDNELFTSCNDWDEQEVGKTKQELSIPLDMPVILFVGKLLPNKQPLALLIAFHQMQKKIDKPAALVFVGEGELRADMEYYCLEHKVENVIFAGFVNQSKIVSYYAVADIFVLLSIQEAWGLVVNEAMCARNALIVSDAVGAAVDMVIPGENGFVFPVGDVDALSKYLTQLVSDQDLCSRMGERSLEIVSRWSFDEDVTGILHAMSCVIHDQ